MFPFSKHKFNVSLCPGVLLMIKLMCIDAIYNQSKENFNQQKRVSFVIDKTDVAQSLKKKQTRRKTP